MNTSLPSLRSTASRFALLALGCAVSFAFVQLAAARTDSPATAQRLADKAPALPVITKTERVKTDDGPRFVLHVTNTSKDALKVTATVQASVAVHNTDKFRHLPEHEIGAGQTWAIPDLVALDKVVLAAEGFAPLEVEVK